MAVTTDHDVSIPVLLLETFAKIFIAHDGRLNISIIFYTCVALDIKEV